MINPVVNGALSFGRTAPSTMSTSPLSLWVVGKVKISQAVFDETSFAHRLVAKSSAIILADQSRLISWKDAAYVTEITWMSRWRDPLIQNHALLVMFDGCGLGKSGSEYGRGWLIEMAVVFLFFVVDNLYKWQCLCSLCVKSNISGWYWSGDASRVQKDALLQPVKGIGKGLS